MYPEDASSIKRGAVVTFGRVLDIGSVDDRCMFVRGVLSLLGIRVVELHLQGDNVVVYCEIGCTFGVNVVVVPLKIYARVQVSLPVLGDVLVFSEDFLEMEGVTLAYVLNTKVVNQ